MIFYPFLHFYYHFLITFSLNDYNSLSESLSHYLSGHIAYQNRVLTQLRKYYPDATNSLSSSTWHILDKFWNLDLSEIDSLMKDRYSSFGPEPRLPSDMLRAILVSVEFKITSYTRFAADLKENHLHANISSFEVGDTPGVGTFYDFHKRLWLSDSKNLSNAIHPPKEKPQKPKGKEEKAAVVEPKKGRIKYRCPKITCKGGTVHCTCNDPCSDAKYGRNVHLVLKDNPRLFNTPPRGSNEWKLKYNAITSAERCNKREKIDYKLEDGKYRSSMMWYCRLFAIMMCQHLDAWVLPTVIDLSPIIHLYRLFLLIFQPNYIHPK